MARGPPVALLQARDDSRAEREDDRLGLYRGTDADIGQDRICTVDKRHGDARGERMVGDRARAGGSDVALDADDAGVQRRVDVAELYEELHSQGWCELQREPAARFGQRLEQHRLPDGAARLRRRQARGGREVHGDAMGRAARRGQDAFRSL